MRPGAWLPTLKLATGYEPRQQSRKGVSSMLKAKKFWYGIAPAVLAIVALIIAAGANGDVG